MKRFMTVFGFAAALMIAGGASGQTQDEDLATADSQLAMIPAHGVATFANGPFNAMPRKEREIVKALIDAQVGSRRDSAGARLLDRDEIAGMKSGTSWRKVFRKLRRTGHVTGKNLRQVVKTYQRGNNLPASYTVISMGTGRKIVVAQKRAASRLNRQGKPVVTMGVGSSSGRSILDRQAAQPGGAAVILASGSVITGSLDDPQSRSRQSAKRGR